MIERKPFYGHIAALITIFIWGTTFISTKVLLQVFTPIEILFIRFAIGYAALWCVCPRRLTLMDKKHNWYFAAAGLCGVTLYYLLENIALTFTYASNVGVIISVAPFFTAVFACWWLREPRPGWRFFLGFAIAMSGIFLISFAGKSGLHMNPMGDLLAIGAAVLWAAYSTLTKKISGFGYHNTLATRRIFFFGLLFMLPVLYLMDFGVSTSQFADSKVILNLLFLGLGASALCFVSWNWAVKVLGTVKTSVYIYIVPIVTTVTSALILHELITQTTVLGIALTLTGLILSERKPIDAQPKQQPSGAQLAEKQEELQ